MSTQKNISTLLNSAELIDFESVEAFDKALADLGKMVSLTEAELVSLYEVFTDDCGDIEVMYGLVHLIEKYPSDASFYALMIASSDMAKKSESWLDRLICRTLNNPQTRESFAIYRKKQSLPMAIVDSLRRIASVPDDVGSLAEGQLTQILSPE
jgi:hypothetical protein